MKWTKNYFLTIPLNVGKYMLKEVRRRRGSREKMKKENILAIQMGKLKGRAVALGYFRTKIKPLFMNSSNQQSDC